MSMASELRNRQWIYVNKILTNESCDTTYQQTTDNTYYPWYTICFPFVCLVIGLWNLRLLDTKLVFEKKQHQQIYWQYLKYQVGKRPNKIHIKHEFATGPKKNHKKTSYMHTNLGIL